MVDFSKIVEDATEQGHTLVPTCNTQQVVQHETTAILQPVIRGIHLSNKVSPVLSIPIRLARKYGIDKECHVLIKDVGNVLLVSKAELKL